MSDSTAQAEMVEGYTDGRDDDDTFKIEIKHRLTDDVVFVAELGAHYDGFSRGFQLGSAVRLAWRENANLREAYLHGADLHGADLVGANLSDADLRDANLVDANLYRTAGISGRVIDGGARSDGYRLLLTRTNPGQWRVIAGGRDFTLTEARKHWTETHGDTDLGHETFLILDHMVALAKLPKWPEQGEANS